MRKGSKWSPEQRHTITEAFLHSKARKRRRPRGPELDKLIESVVQVFDENPSIGSRDIAARFGISRDYVVMLLHRAGRTPHRGFIGKNTGIGAGSIAKAFEDGLSITEIAKSLGLSKRWTADVLTGLGFPTPKLPRPKTPEEWDEMARLYQSGHSTQAIMKKFHVGIRPLKRELAQRGIAMRPRAAHVKGWHAERKAKLADYERLLASRAQPKKKRGRVAESEENKTYFQIGKEVEREIPISQKNDRHSIVEARRRVADRTHLDRDVVAQYHGKFRRYLKKHPL